MMKIFYLSCSKLSHSVNAVYIKGLQQNGVIVSAFQVSKRLNGYLTAARYLKDSKGADLVMVGYDSPGLVTFFKLLTGKKVVYNALCSVYERLIVSRALAGPFSLKAAYYWFLDFLASHSADLIMVETDAQIIYFKKLFGIPKKKLFRAWTGVDEEKFYFDPTIEKFPEFTVVFRGALLPESGWEYVVRAAKKLEAWPIQFSMLIGGQELSKAKKLIEELKPRNLKFITEFLSDKDLRELMQRCHLSLGQLSDHLRSQRTIPHKCYESLAMKLPYLTASNQGVLELLKDGETCIVCESINAESLAQKILWARSHLQELEQIAENGYRLFKKNLTAKSLAGILIAKLTTL